jgi:hypothetical protein
MSKFHSQVEAKTTGSDEMLFIENLSIKDTQSIDSSTFREGESILIYDIFGHGFDPILVRGDIKRDVLEYIQSLYDKTYPVISELFPADPCLVWALAKDKSGYGRHTRPKKYQKRYFMGSNLVHRYIWQKCVGDPIATIDHACGNTACCNLRHLRELSLDINQRLGDHRELYR